MLVVDDLVSWLVGRLADAGYKKLSTRLRGSEQERALRVAAVAAVQDTAAELSPSDAERAGQLAVAISGVFGKPKSPGLRAGQRTLLEALQAGIAERMAMLDDARQTGAGQSAAPVLGVPGSVVAEKLTGHLVREILVRGFQGGPLTPLADHLNHELTQDMLAQLSGEVRALATQGGAAPATVGWPLAEVVDPFALEVHRPVQADAGSTVCHCCRCTWPAITMLSLPAGGGRSGGDAARSRCWSAGPRRARPGPAGRRWSCCAARSRGGGCGTRSTLAPGGGAGRTCRGIGPRTVVWLNEAQRYLEPR